MKFSPQKRENAKRENGFSVFNLIFKSFCVPSKKLYPGLLESDFGQGTEYWTVKSPPPPPGAETSDQNLNKKNMLSVSRKHVIFMWK